MANLLNPYVHPGHRQFDLPSIIISQIPMKIVVTGAAGRLGSAVCRELLAGGHEVIATDIMAAKDQDFPIRVVNLLDEKAVTTELTGAEAIVHLANHTTYVGKHPATVYIENVTMNYHIARLAVESDARRVIFASSVQVVSGADEREGAPPNLLRPAYIPADGNLPAIPRNAYSLSKEAGEQTLRYLDRTHGISGVAIRFPLLWAERSSLNFSYSKAEEFFTWLSYPDGARLVSAILNRDLPGFRIYFPCARRPLNELSVEENLRRHYEEVPLRAPRTEIVSLVDQSVITRETGWMPQDD